MKKWLKRFWPFKKRKARIPEITNLGPCKATWGRKGEIPLIWQMAEIKINWKQSMAEIAYGDVQLNLPVDRQLLGTHALEYTVKRFNEKRELIIENLFPDWKCGGISDMKIHFYKTSFKLIDLANKIVKYKIHFDDNLQYGRIE